MIKFLNLKFFKYLIPILVVILWSIITLKCPYIHMFNADEIWAYDIAADLNIIEIFKLMHYEGHAFVWYLILKPFTHFNSLFPGIIKYINWGFCFGIMILLWFFAPMKNYIKLLITISSPFFLVYPTLGRPYGLAIFLLFLITILYKKRLEKPFLYSILIFIASNTCINATFVTSILSIFFLYDLYKENSWKSKKSIIATTIIFLGFFLLLCQWIPFHSPTYFSYFHYNKLLLFRYFFFGYPYKFLILLAFIIFVPLFYISLRIFFKEMNELRWKIFAIYTVIITTIFYIFIAPGQNYHFYFYYIYLIMLYWLLLENYKDFKSNKLLFVTCSTFLVLVSLIFNVLIKIESDWFVPQRNIEYSMKQINTFVPKGSEIYIPLDCMQVVIPYLKNDYKIKTLYNVPIPSFEAYKGIYQDAYITPDKINVSNNKKAYFLDHVEKTVAYKTPDLKDYCVKTQIYLLCKLPYKEKIEVHKPGDIVYYDIAKMNKITVNQIKMILPQQSTIYMDPNLLKRFSKDLKNTYIIKNLDNIEKNKNVDEYYIFILHSLHKYLGIPTNCVCVNRNYILCKYTNNAN